MVMYWILGGLLVIGLVVWALLSAIASRGGERSGDASQIANDFINQVRAQRGDDPIEGQTWDGVDRMKTGPEDPGGG